MTHQDSLTQLTAEVAQLRQQMEQVNQRLDMIYGAVTRLTGSSQPEPDPLSAKKSSSSTDLLSATMMMDPGSMLSSLRQHAQNVGLTVPSETVERLKTGLPERE